MSNVLARKSFKKALKKLVAEKQMSNFRKNMPQVKKLIAKVSAYIETTKLDNLFNLKKERERERVETKVNKNKQDRRSFFEAD